MGRWKFTQEDLDYIKTFNWKEFYITEDRLKRIAKILKCDVMEIVKTLDIKLNQLSKNEKEIMRLKKLCDEMELKNVG